jgi:hypothetical protein
MRRSILGLLIGAAACGSDSNGPAAGYECLGAPLPTTAPATVTVAGQIRSNALAPTALPGAIVTAFRTGDTTTLAADTSDSPGLYSLTITTGGTPVDGYLRVTHSGQVDTYAYPSRPLFMDLATNVLMPTSGELDFLAAAVNVTQADGNGFIGVIVKDCNGVPISGATVSTTPAAGAVKYNSGSTPSGSATSTSSDGVAYVFNVTAGNVTVRANGGGNTLRAHVVNARADLVTLTEIQP